MVSGGGGSGGAIGARIAVVLALSVAYWGVESMPKWTLSSLPSGCPGPDLAPVLLLAPFHPPSHSPACSPSTVLRPYPPPYPSNVLRPSPALSLSLSLSPCSSSLSSRLTNTRSYAVLADDIRFRILHFICGHICVQNYCAWAIGLDVNAGDDG